MMEPLRVLLVDDHALFRKGVAGLLAEREDMVVVGEAADGLEALVRARETMPDVILMDIRMPGGSGVEAVTAIKAEMPEARIIMLTVSDSDRDLFAAIEAGADGYLLKDLEPRQLCGLLAGVRRGEAAFSGAIAAKMLQAFRQPAQSDAQRPELTDRELDVLRLVAEGGSNKEIASTLVISENTVKSYMASIMEKLHLRNRVQAAVYAVRRGLVDGASEERHRANTDLEAGP